MSEQKHTPTYGCLEAAETFIDWEAADGINVGFKLSVEGCASSADARDMIAHHIDRLTHTSELLAALKDILGFLRRNGYNTDLVKAVIAKAEGSD